MNCVKAYAISMLIFKGNVGIVPSLIVELLDGRILMVCTLVITMHFCVNLECKRCVDCILLNCDLR